MKSNNQHKRLAEVIKEAQKLKTYEGINWEDSCWDLTKHCERSRAHDKRRLNIYFTRQRNRRLDSYIPFEEPFAGLAKSIVVTRASERTVGYVSQKRITSALRFLYESLLRGGTTDPTLLEPRHFQRAVLDAYQTMAHGSAYQLGTILREIADFIDEHEITYIPINFQNPISHPPHGDGLDEQSQAEGLKKMPSRATLEALADASNNPLDEDERMLLRVIDLHVVGGFRNGEATTIPLDCWVEETVIGNDGRPKIDSTTGKPIKRYGLRYWPEKGGETLIKWVPDCAVPLAKEQLMI